MKTLLFYGYKGGSGRTLAVAHVATYLAQLGQAVLVLDLDVEAPGVNSRLVPTAAIQRGFVDLVAAYLAQKRLPALEDYVVPVRDVLGRHPIAPGRIEVIPAGVAVGPRYWQALAATNWQAFVTGVGDGAQAGHGVAFLLALKQAIAARKIDYLVIDSRTGVSELGSAACTIMADHLVCLCNPTGESLDGAREVVRALRAAPRPPDLAPLHVTPVLSRLPDLSTDGWSAAAIARDEALRVATAMERLALQPDADVDAPVVVHRVPGVEVQDWLTATSVEVESSMAPSLIGEGSLFSDYMVLFRRLLPAELIDAHMRNLVDAAQRRAFKNPQLAHDELRTIARQYREEHTLRAYLELCRLRDCFDDDALDTAQALAARSADLGDELLWDVIVHATAAGDYDDLTSEQAEFCGRVWLRRDERARQGQGPGVDVEVALRVLHALSSPSSDEDVLGRLIDALHERAVRGDSDAAIGLAAYLVDQREGEEAIALLHKATNLRSPPVQRAWARAVVSLERRDRAAALLEDPMFDESNLRGEPRLWVDLARLSGRLDDLLTKLANDVGRPGRHASGRREIEELFATAGRSDDLRRLVQRRGSLGLPTSTVVNLRDE